MTNWTPTVYDGNSERAKPLKSDGGDGGDMLEMRVKHLEEDMKDVKSDMKAVREKLARIEGEVSRLPGYPGIAAIVGLIVALATAAQIAARFIP